MTYFAAFIISASLLLQPVEPTPAPAPGDGVISVPVGPLPWALPVLPSWTVDFDVATATFEEVSHGDDYAANLADIESRFEPASTVETGASAEVDDWIGDGGILPDLTVEDFDTGINVTGDNPITASEMAVTLGTNIGTMFARIRGLTQMDIDFGGGMVVILVLVLCLCWMILIEVVKFAIRFADMCWSLITTIIELIPFVE